MKTDKGLKLIPIVVFLCTLSSTAAGQIEVLRPDAILNQGDYDTLTWRKLSEPTVNFGLDRGDSLAVWFRPQAACSLIAIRFYSYDYQGSSLTDVWDGSRYDGHITTTDSTDSNGWIGNFQNGRWVPGHILGHSPVGWSDTDLEHHLWGPLPYTITGEHTGLWIEIPTAWAIQGEVDLGIKPFFLSITFYRTEGWGIAAENEGTTPYHTFKYQASGSGPDGQHTGWFLHSASVWIEAVVKYYHTTNVEGDDNEKPPSAFILYQNYPNPFNATTDIRYEISDMRSPHHTTLRIYNILGQEVTTLVNEPQRTSSYIVTWDGRDDSGEEVSSGIYFYRLETNNTTEKNHTSSFITGRMILLR
ncbi:MAG: T9SS type A sorting domain-containing protein [Gemmatimonadota bacterium]|nr:MAG: T9SS type A sorting domain-containing protein [Gemmatimonadota bacterium]